MSIELLTAACFRAEWEKAKAIIHQKPELAFVGPDSHGDIPAFWICARNNVGMLRYMLETILSFGKEAVRGAFERENKNGDTPAHIAARHNRVACLEFLINNCPSGPKILELQDSYSWATPHIAVYYGNLEALEFILRYAPSGLRLLERKDRHGRRPLDWATPEFLRQFSSKRIKRIGYERESSLISPDLFEKESFVSLVFSILRQDLEIRKSNSG